jgi:hypothetical protein
MRRARERTDGRGIMSTSPAAECSAPVTLTAIHPEVGKDDYQAETTLQIVDLMSDPEDGSNWLRKWGGGN